MSFYLVSFYLVIKAVPLVGLGTSCPQRCSTWSRAPRRANMISDDVQRIELDARRRSLDEYKLRCQDLRTENDGLKKEKEQREVDALQIISFLR